MWLGWCVCTVKNWIWWHVVEKFRHCAWCHKCPWLQKRDLLSCRDPSMICTVVLLQQFAVTFFFHYFGFSFCKGTFSKLCRHGHKLFGLGCHKDAVGVSPVCLVRNNEHFLRVRFPIIYILLVLQEHLFRWQPKSVRWQWHMFCEFHTAFRPGSSRIYKLE